MILFWLMMGLLVISVEALVLMIVWDIFMATVFGFTYLTFGTTFALACVMAIIDGLLS